MLDILKRLSPRVRRDRSSARKVRSEMETLRRWSQRSPDDRFARQG